MSAPTDIAVNLFPLRPGASLDEFTRFAVEVDRPTCLSQDVVLAFDVIALTRRDPAGPAVDVVEIIETRSWDEWVETRDAMPEMATNNERFQRLADPSRMLRYLGRRIAPER
jgi:hypothetical protein